MRLWALCMDSEFAPPGPLLREAEGGSVALVEHRFPPHLHGLRATGIDNVGWLTFRRDPDGLRCLEWWRDRCNEWCYDRIEGNRYADQKYLEGFFRHSERIVVLSHRGANVAPWNIAGSSFAVEGDEITVDGDPLNFYHFHGLKRTGERAFDARLRRYGGRMTKPIRNRIYRPYLEALLAAEAELEAFGWTRPPVSDTLASEANEHAALPLYRRIGSLLNRVARRRPGEDRLELEPAKAVETRVAS